MADKPCLTITDSLGINNFVSALYCEIFDGLEFCSQRCFDACLIRRKVFICNTNSVNMYLYSLVVSFLRIFQITSLVEEDVMPCVKCYRLTLS